MPASQSGGTPFKTMVKAAPPLGLAGLLYGVLCIGVLRYCLPFPWAEHLRWAVFLDDGCAGRLSVGDFFEPVANHVYAIPLALSLASATWTDWNHTCEIGASLLLGAAFWGVVLAGCWRSLGAAKNFPILWFAPLLSVIVFSFNQSCNWMWPYQTAVFLANLMLASAFLALAAPRLSWPRLMAAFLLGLGASLSWGSGMAFWPATVIYMIIRPGGWHGKAAVARSIVWCLGAGAVCLGYLLLNRQQLAGGDGPGLWDRVWIALQFVPINLGANVVTFSPASAMPAGLAALAGGVVLLARCFRKRAVPDGEAAFLPLCMLFAVLVSGMIGFGLADQAGDLRTPAYGSLMEGALLRYTSVSQFYWVGVVFYLFRAARGLRPSMARAASVALLLILMGLFLRSSWSGLGAARERYALYMPLVRRVVVEDLPALPTRLQWPYGYDSTEELAILRAREWSIFRPDAWSFWQNNDGRSNF